MCVVTPDADQSSGLSASPGLGPALRRAWLGYQLRLDHAMTEAGFGERRFPDGRVLRLCSGETGSTISAIGRELGITRQGASKVVANLREGGYVAVAGSTTSKRESSVTLTPLGVEYVVHQRAAARAIDDELSVALGQEAFSALKTLLDILDPGQGLLHAPTCVARPTSIPRLQFTYRCRSGVTSGGDDQRRHRSTRRRSAWHCDSFRPERSAAHPLSRRFQRHCTSAATTLRTRGIRAQQPRADYVPLEGHFLPRAITRVGAPVADGSSVGIDQPMRFTGRSVGPT